MKYFLDYNSRKDGGRSVSGLLGTCILIRFSHLNTYGYEHLHDNSVKSLSCLLHISKQKSLIFLSDCKLQFRIFKRFKHVKLAT